MISLIISMAFAVSKDSDVLGGIRITWCDSPSWFCYADAINRVPDEWFGADVLVRSAPDRIGQIHFYLLRSPNREQIKAAIAQVRDDWLQSVPIPKPAAQTIQANPPAIDHRRAFIDAAELIVASLALCLVFAKSMTWLGRSGD